MSKVNVTIKVMPEDEEVSTEQLVDAVRESIPRDSKVEDTEVAESVFGLEPVRALVQIPDRKGGTVRLESALEDVDVIKSVEIERVNRS